MANYNVDTTGRKLIILFLLDKMEIPLTENTIVDIVTNRNDWINYMECIETLDALISSKLIYRLDTTDKEACYALSCEGRHCVDLFFNKLDQDIRNDISEFAKINVKHIKRKQEYVSDYDKLADGSYMNTFKIREPRLGIPLFELKIKTESRATAIEASKQWIDKAPEIYEYIYSNLILPEEQPKKKTKPNVKPEEE